MKYVDQSSGCGRILNPKMAKIRTFERKVYERAVLYRMIESVCGYEGVGRTVNFSFGGVQFESPDRFEVTNLLEILIPTEHGVAVADAAVVFVHQIAGRRFRVGVKFVRLLPEDRSRLEGAADGCRRSNSAISCSH